MTEAKWTNGKTIVKGCYEFFWSKRDFYIILYKNERYSKKQIQFWADNEEYPNFGKFKLIKDN